MSRWPQVPFGSLLATEPRNGLSPSRSGTAPGSVLTLSAVTGRAFDASARKEARFARPLAARDEVSAADFLICRGNGNPALVGRGQFPDRDCRGPRSRTR